MKKPFLLAASLGFAAFLIPAPESLAAASPGPKARIFAEFDTNKNGVIDGAEVAAVRKAFTTDPKGQFALYDGDKDGKLDDKEIAAIKPPGTKQAGEKKGSSKKKADAEKSGDGKAVPAP